ncbi:MAG: hypothetical protein RLZZ480_74 [Candidatus Parcubacteria bacterium]|jgi:thiol-disulfide isomerase/thioredoxin
MNRAAYITLAVMAVVVLLGIGYIFLLDESEKQTRNETPAARALLPGTETESFTDKDGNPLSVADDFGKVIVAISWASWCPQCADDIKKLDELAREFEGKDVVFYAINRAEDKYSAERYLATMTAPERVKIILDPKDHFFAASAGYAMPETILYDREGGVAAHIRGNLAPDELKNAIYTALE